MLSTDIMVHKNSEHGVIRLEGILRVTATNKNEEKKQEENKIIRSEWKINNTFSISSFLLFLWKKIFTMGMVYMHV